MKVLIVSKVENEVARLKRLVVSALGPFQTIDVIIQVLDEINHESAVVDMAISQQFACVVIGTSGAVLSSGGAIRDLAQRAPDTFFVSIGRAHVPEPNVMTFRPKELTPTLLYKALYDWFKANGMPTFSMDDEAGVLTRVSDELDRVNDKLDVISESLMHMNKTAIEKYATTIRQHMGAIAFSVLIIIILASAVWVFLITMPETKINAIAGVCSEDGGAPRIIIRERNAPEAGEPVWPNALRE